MTRERLISLLWPDQGSESGRRNLSEALHVIRREFGDDVIASVGDTVSLSDSLVGSDVQEFRAALAAGDGEKAVRLYAGPFLDGWFIADSREFDEWAESERSRLATEYSAVLQSLALANETSSNWHAAAGRWRQVSDLNRDATRPVLRHARALAVAGDPGAAIRAVEAHVAYLRAEGLPVDSELTAFDAQLRSGAIASLSVGSVDLLANRTPVMTVLPSPAFAAPAIPAPIARPWSNPWVLAVVSVVAAVVAYQTVSSRSARQGQDLPPNHIAVLFFTSAPRDSIAWLADGITARLIDELSAVPTLKVISATGALYYRDLPTRPPLDSIARAFGVGTIVEGRVERSAGATRVTVALVDARTNARIGRPKVIVQPVGANDAFALQDQLSWFLATELRRQLGAEIRLVASRSGTSSSAAQELSDRADHALNTAWTLTRNGSALDLATARRKLAAADSLFARAAALDPSWLEPVVARGWVARHLARIDRDGAQQALRTAILAADNVLERDSVYAPALELRGAARWQLVVLRAGGSERGEDVASARTDLNAALRLDSARVVAAATLSQLLRVTAVESQDRTAAIALARHAYERDAYLANAEDAVSVLYRATKALGQSDSARAWCDRGRAIAPSDYRFTECLLALMRMDLKHADPHEAARLVRQLDLLDPAEKAVEAGRPYSPVYRRLVAATVMAYAGWADSARILLTAAMSEVETDKDLRVDLKHDETLLRLALGERKAAMAALRSYLERRPEFYGAVLTDPAFRQFRLDSAALAAAIR